MAERAIGKKESRTPEFPQKIQVSGKSTKKGGLECNQQCRKDEGRFFKLYLQVVDVYGEG
jgi:hypothetical protein